MMVPYNIGHIGPIWPPPWDIFTFYLMLYTDSYVMNSVSSQGVSGKYEATSPQVIGIILITDTTNK